MKYVLQETIPEGDGLKKRFYVTVPAEELTDKVQEVYAFLAMQSGADYITKQPKEALEKRFGANLGDRVASCLANQYTDEIIEAEQLCAALEPVIHRSEDFSELTDFHFDTTIFLKPTCELSSYEPVELALPNIAITDEMVEENLQAIVNERAKYIPDDQAAKVGLTTTNVVSVETTKFGMPVPALCFERVTCRIGDGTLVPQIEEQLLDMAPQEEKTVSFDITSKNFLGLDVTETMDATIVLIALVKKEVPQITDAWVKENVAGAHDVDGFRELVRANLLKHAQIERSHMKEEAVVTELAKRLPPVSLPDEYCDYVRAGLLQNISVALAKQDMAEDEFLAAQGLSKSQFMLQMKARAHDVLCQGLALDAFACHEKIVLGEADVASALKSIASGNESQTLKMLQMNGRTYQLREMATRSKVRACLMESAVLLER